MTACEIWANQVVSTPGGQTSLPDFLRQCAARLARPTDLEPHHLAFITAGLAAARIATNDGWVQLDLTRSSELPAAGLYLALRQAARQLLDSGLASNFFVMHKPPGIRARFQHPADGRSELVDELRRAIADWSARSVVRSVGSAVYEPESHLFGGPQSMRHVHRLFTLDTLRWLDFHVEQDSAVPAWSFSLHTLRALLDGLAIVGWEDLDVWERICRQTGRRLPEQVRITPGYQAAADGVRDSWRLISSTLKQGYPTDTALTAMRTAAGQWRAEYFADPAAVIGPREAAAFFAIYSWNRGRLPFVRQALISEALADRRAL